MYDISNIGDLLKREVQIKTANFDSSLKVLLWYSYIRILFYPRDEPPHPGPDSVHRKGPPKT